MRKLSQLRRSLSELASGSDGWGLVDGRGERAFVPTDDPRHPRNVERHAAA